MIDATRAQDCEDAMLRRFRLTIGVKIYGIIALCFAGLAGMVLFGIAEQGRALEEQKKRELVHLGEMVISIIKEEHAAAQKGFVSEDEAKKRAATRVGALRYDNGNYFWINDLHPRVVMHPVKPDLIGKDVGNVKDGRGEPLYGAFVALARSKGSGFLFYHYIKPGVAEPQPKLSRIESYQPWGWVIGTGVTIEDIETQAWQTTQRALVAALALLVVIGVVSTLVAQRTARGIRATTSAMRDLAEGRLDVVLPGLGRRDEIGEIAAAVEAFKVRAVEKTQRDVEAVQAEEARRAEERRLATEREVRERQAAEVVAAQERRAAMVALADRFQATVGDVISTVATAAGRLETAAATLAHTAETTQGLSGSVASASQQASANVQSVASAAEEMTSSVGEIGRQVRESSRIAAEAVAQAKRTDARIAELAAAATRIGDVVKLITAIAEQTNLLALNATIEAARAGDAGKGFAVVAQEVKALAAQTGKATEEIETQISGMQSATEDSVSAIKEIGGTIQRVSDIAVAIAAAVDQQGATTSEIARNVGEAARGTAGVSENIADVSHGAAATGSASAQVLTEATSLSRESNRLKDEVDEFLASVRAA
jgi:methyl-accepting chemotaxis protein